MRDERGVLDWASRRNLLFHDQTPRAKFRAQGDSAESEDSAGAGLVATGVFQGVGDDHSIEMFQGTAVQVGLPVLKPGMDKVRESVLVAVVQCGGHQIGLFLGRRFAEQFGRKEFRQQHGA